MHNNETTTVKPPAPPIGVLLDELSERIDDVLTAVDQLGAHLSLILREADSSKPPEASQQGGGSSVGDALIGGIARLRRARENIGELVNRVDL